MKPQDILAKIESLTKLQFLPIIGPEKGKVLEKLIKKHKPKRILEIGTLVGYSAILMAQFLPKGGKITTIEIDPQMAKFAVENFKKAGVVKLTELKIGNAIDVIPTLKDSFNLLFLDAEKVEYLDYLKLAEPKLAKNAIVVADNVGMFADVMKDYLDYVRNSSKYESKTIDFGFDAVEVSQRV